MNCIIIEDQAPAQRILKKYIKDYGNLELKATFTDAIQSIEYINKHKVDLIFLDIHLPKLSGIDFLKSLRNPPAVIFTTAFPDFAIEGYDLNVVDYLLKPFAFTRFLQAVSKVPIKNVETIEAKNKLAKNDFIFIKSGFEHHKIDLNEVVYFHSDKDYTEIHIGNKKYLSNESLKYWEEFLSAKAFVRTHKSYIINKSHIMSIRSSEVILAGAHRVSIGRAYKERVSDIIKDES